ncbi:MAG: DUF4831 family protein [Bacteroidales bacterium]|nr:DUF4831 family protein [Bacteroidales bacterium]
MTRKIFIAIVLLLSYSLSEAQISSVRVRSSSENFGQNGVFYALPRAVLKVDIVVAKIKDLPGPYASYAPQVLGVNDYIKREEVSYAVKGVYIQTLTEADPDAVYFLNFGERSGKSDRAFIIQLQNNGVLKGMNETSSSNEADIKAKVELRADYFKQDFDYLANLNQVVRIDTIIRRISVDTSNIEDVIYNRTLVEKSMLERAQDAAKNYMDIHKNRVELLSGFQEVNYPAQTIALMNNELKNMEEAYLALFKGKRYIGEEQYSFYVIPEGVKTRQTYPLCKFSKENGLTDLATNGGTRINLMLQTNGVTDVLKNQEAGDQSLGVFYRVPETARVWVDYNGSEFAKNTFLIPQLGVLQWVYTTKTILSTDPKTGMLKALEIK